MDVRSTPISGAIADIAAPPLSAKTGCEQSQQTNSLFDHLVGAGEQRWRHGEPEHSGGLGVDGQLELCPQPLPSWAADSPESHVGVLAVGELKLFCISLAAFGIERAVRRLDILEALSGLSNGSSDSEIIGLSFDHQPISPGRKKEIGVLWT
jgi:hypothetical protein